MTDKKGIFKMEKRMKKKGMRKSVVLGVILLTLILGVQGVMAALSDCSDGIDNDGDGDIDYPDDFGCKSESDKDETNSDCSDGIDNDLDGNIDYPDDTGCESLDDRSEVNPGCSDGIDNDLDGNIDYPDDTGCEDIYDRTESVVLGYANGCLTYGDKLKNVFGDVSYSCWSTICNVCVLMSEAGNYSASFSKCNGLPRCGFSGNGANITFDVTPPNLTVNSPSNGEVFNSKKVLFDLEFDEPSSIYYIDNVNGRGRWNRLCSNCDDSYFKEVAFKEGENNITIKAKDRNDQFVEVVRVFSVDTNKPKVKRVGPTKGFASGEFSVEFKESNPASLVFYFGADGIYENLSIEIGDFCSRDNDYYECVINQDVSSYDGGEMDYYFAVTDIANNVDESKVITIDVDMTPPVIDNLEYDIYGKYVYFDILIDEEYFDEVGYSYVDENGKYKEKRLCSKLVNSVCEKRVTFKDGPHEITIFVLDEAGQNDTEVISFFTDSKNPKILKTYPKKGFASGLFEVEFKEANPERLTLHYGNSESTDVDLGNCVIDHMKHYCDVTVDLALYDGEEMDYYFELEDKVGNLALSKPITLTVDTTDPFLNNPGLFWVQGIGRYSKYIYFDFNITEENFDEITYTYLDSRNKLREKTLCSRLKEGVCEVKKSFRRGSYSLNLEIIDEAGNSVPTEVVEFVVA